jgi:RHS repeat-associated protein
LFSFSASALKENAEFFGVPQAKAGKRDSFLAYYYPFSLPIGTMGSAAAGFTLNKNKYQSNEYSKDLGLNWMDFHNRQYDPQLGRFLSIDPLAAFTSNVSPYAAMDNNLVSMVDPLGLSPGDLNHMEANTTQLFRPTNPYESVILSNKGRCDDLSYAFNEAFFQGMDEHAESYNEEAVGGDEGPTASTTQGDASAPNSSSSSEVVNNDASSSADAGSASSDGDDGKKTPIGPFTPAEDNGGEIPEMVKWDLNGDGHLSLSEAKTGDKMGTVNR